ncbi:MAG: hypothetical protein V8Q57_00650 [Blautia sp.]
MLDGYPEYAKKNGLPDPANLGTYFVEYMQSQDGQSRLMKGLTAMIDTSGGRRSFPGDGILHEIYHDHLCRCHHKRDSE